MAQDIPYVIWYEGFRKELYRTDIEERLVQFRGTTELVVLKFTVKNWMEGIDCFAMVKLEKGSVGGYHSRTLCYNSLYGRLFHFGILGEGALPWLWRPLKVNLRMYQSDWKTMMGACIKVVIYLQLSLHLSAWKPCASWKRCKFEVCPRSRLQRLQLVICTQFWPPKLLLLQQKRYHRGKLADKYGAGWTFVFTDCPHHISTMASKLKGCGSFVLLWYRKTIFSSIISFYILFPFIPGIVDCMFSMLCSTTICNMQTGDPHPFSQIDKKCVAYALWSRV